MTPALLSEMTAQRKSLTLTIEAEYADIRNADAEELSCKECTSIRLALGAHHDPAVSLAECVGRVVGECEQAASERDAILVLMYGACPRYLIDEAHACMANPPNTEGR
jgi:hypothetical protein